MENDWLSKDDLFHNRTEAMSLEQIFRFDVLLRINHFLNCAISSEDRERSSGECLLMQYTVFLEKFVSSFEGTINQERKCNNVLIYDDFIRIADFSYDAIRDIIINPSTQIEKRDTKVIANKAHGLGSRSMRWLSQRPGRTIEEKVSPQNKVLTSKTFFSADTKENRELRYLYRIIYEAITERLKGTECNNCRISNGCDYYKWISKLKRLLAMNNKLKSGELSDVKPVKQTYQNNKLMCDKNYKIVWDAVQMLSRVEEKIDIDYNSNLNQRLAMILYWALLGKMNSYCNIKINDTVGRLIDKDGRVWFGMGGDYCDSQINQIYLLNECGIITKILNLELKNCRIQLVDNGLRVFELDVNQYFEEMNNFLNEKYEMVFAEEK